MPFVCPLCDESNRIIPDINEGEIDSHLIVFLVLEKQPNGKYQRIYHVHGPIEDKVLMKEFVKSICKESGLELEE